MRPPVIRQRFERQLDFARARLSPVGVFGLHLTIGAAVLVAAAWLFGGVAEDLLTGDALTVFDVIISEWFRVHATSAGTARMVLISNLASPSAVVGLCVATAMVLLWRRAWYALLALALAVPGGAFLNILLKAAFARTRPGWADLDLWGYSFPSGHTMSATLVYGFVGFFFFMFVARSAWMRGITVLLVFVLIAAVGFSRIYLGAHYVSDVLAAFGAGTAWLAICLTAVETLRRYRLRAPQKS